MTFKNIKIKMKGGKSRMQRVKVLASGKYKFVKNLGSKIKKRTKKSNPRPARARKVRRNLAKRKRSRRSRQITIPLAPIIGLGAGIFTKRPAWGYSAFEHLMRGETGLAFESIKQSYLGIHPEGRFDPTLMTHGLLPLVIGTLVHKFVGGAPLNVNRMLGAANVPLIRI